MGASKILLVEDNLVVAKGLTMQLQNHGYVVTHVEEAAHAEAAVRTALPDVIILDVGLPTRDPNSPVWDGLDFLEWLHYMHLTVPVIIHSITSPQIIQQRLHNAQASAYLQKPVRLALMLETIERVMTEARGGQPAPPEDISPAPEQAARPSPPSAATPPQ
jgi:two-component system, OmpR family, alkaline phosphatase synthesis response regulator PhoP